MVMSIGKGIVVALLASSGLAQTTTAPSASEDGVMPSAYPGARVEATPSWIISTTPTTVSTAVAVPTDGQGDGEGKKQAGDGEGGGTMSGSGSPPQAGSGVSFQDPGFILLSAAFGVMSLGIFIL